MVGSRDSAARRGVGRKHNDILEVGDGEKRVTIEDLAVNESLQQMPRHWIQSETAAGTQEHKCLGGWR